MLKWLMHRGVKAFERQWAYDAAYLHELIDVDPRAAWAFQRATALGRYRRGLPADALAAAGITAVRSEDCGPCTQLGVSMAEAAGVDPAVLRAVLRGDPRWRTIPRPMGSVMKSNGGGDARPWSAWRSPSSPRACIPR